MDGSSLISSIRALDRRDASKKEWAGEGDPEITWKPPLTHFPSFATELHEIKWI